MEVNRKSLERVANGIIDLMGGAERVDSLYSMAFGKDVRLARNFVESQRVASTPTPTPTPKAEPKAHKVEVKVVDKSAKQNKYANDSWTKQTRGADGRFGSKVDINKNKPYDKSKYSNDSWTKQTRGADGRFGSKVTAVHASIGDMFKVNGRDVVVISKPTKYGTDVIYKVADVDTADVFSVTASSLAKR